MAHPTYGHTAFTSAMNLRRFSTAIPVVLVAHNPRIRSSCEEVQSQRGGRPCRIQHRLQQMQRLGIGPDRWQGWRIRRKRS